MADMLDASLLVLLVAATQLASEVIGSGRGSLAAAMHR
jgi:hypothetical protein